MVAALPPSLKELISEELNRLCWERMRELWSYCLVLFVLLTLGGWLVMGTLRIAFPFALICGFGGITGTLFTRSHRRSALGEIQTRFDEVSASTRSPDEFRNSIRKLNIPSLNILSQRIFR